MYLIRREVYFRRKEGGLRNGASGLGCQISELSIQYKLSTFLAVKFRITAPLRLPHVPVLVNLFEMSNFSISQSRGLSWDLWERVFIILKSNRNGGFWYVHLMTCHHCPIRDGFVGLGLSDSMPAELSPINPLPAPLQSFATPVKENPEICRVDPSLPVCIHRTINIQGYAVYYSISTSNS
jgi:hypothetical protein